jgi:hypothetical protein
MTTIVSKPYNNKKFNNQTLYTESQFLDFCYQVFGDYKLTSGGKNIEVVCPACKEEKGNFYFKKKLSIMIDSQVSHCWVCGLSGKNLKFLIKKYKPEFLVHYTKTFLEQDILLINGNKDKEAQLGDQFVKLPDDFILLATADRNSPRVDFALNYLKDRGASQESTLWRWRLGISNASEGLPGRVIVPSLDKLGRVNYYSARAISDNLSPKYENPHIRRDDIVFNELNINWKEELILVEGVFDLLKCPDNATCLLGCELPTHFKLFQEIVTNKTPVVLALDPDAKKSTFRLAKKFFENGVSVKIIFLGNDQKDIGSLRDQTEFNNLLKDAIVYNQDWFLKNQINGIV